MSRGPPERIAPDRVPRSACLSGCDSRSRIHTGEQRDECPIDESPRHSARKSELDHCGDHTPHTSVCRTRALFTAVARTPARTYARTYTRMHVLLLCFTESRRRDVAVSSERVITSWSLHDAPRADSDRRLTASRGLHPAAVSPYRFSFARLFRRRLRRTDVAVILSRPGATLLARSPLKAVPYETLIAKKAFMIIIALFLVAIDTRAR